MILSNSRYPALLKLTSTSSASQNFAKITFSFQKNSYHLHHSYPTVFRYISASFQKANSAKIAFFFPGQLSQINTQNTSIPKSISPKSSLLKVLLFNFIIFTPIRLVSHLPPLASLHRVLPSIRFLFSYSFISNGFSQLASLFQHFASSHSRYHCRYSLLLTAYLQLKIMVFASNPYPSQLFPHCLPSAFGCWLDSIYCPVYRMLHSGSWVWGFGVWWCSRKLSFWDGMGGMGWNEMIGRDGFLAGDAAGGEWMGGEWMNEWILKK